MPRASVPLATRSWSTWRVTVSEPVAPGSRASVSGARVTERPGSPANEPVKVSACAAVLVTVMALEKLAKRAVGTSTSRRGSPPRRATLEGIPPSESASRASICPAPSALGSRPKLWALVMIRLFTWSGVHSGWAWRSSAATPATCGVAIDVPEMAMCRPSRQREPL